MSYAEITRLSRAGMRRFVALAADGQRFELRDVLCDPQILGPVPLADAERRLADYVLDRCARPLSGALDETGSPTRFSIDLSVEYGRGERGDQAEAASVTGGAGVTPEASLRSDLSVP